MEGLVVPSARYGWTLAPAADRTLRIAGREIRFQTDAEGRRSGGALDLSLPSLVFTGESTVAARQHTADVAPDASFDWPHLSESAWTPTGTPRGITRGRLTRMAVLDDEMQATTTVFRQGEYAMFCFEFEVHQDIGVPVGILEISNAYNILVHSKNSLQLELDLPGRVAAGGRVRFIHRVKVGLEPAEYAFNVGLLSMHEDDYARVHELTQQDLNERLVWVCRQLRAGAFVVTFGFGRGMALTHAGICDLPSAGKVQCAPVLRDDAPRP